MMSRPLSFWLKTILLLIGVAVCGGADASRLDEILALPREVPAELPALRGDWQLFLLNSRCVVVAGLYDRALTVRLREEYGSRLALVDRSTRELQPRRKADWRELVRYLDRIRKSNYLTVLLEDRWRGTELAKINPLVPKWMERFCYRFAFAEVWADYLPEIAANFQTPGFFLLEINDVARPVSRLGYWVNAAGSKRLPVPEQGKELLIDGADLVFFAYLELPEALQEGDRLRISSLSGESAELAYQETRSISRAIKVNQVGYLPDAGAKYGYLGMWLGSLGAMPVDSWADQPFYLRRENDDQVVFEGKLAWRAHQQTTTINQVTMPVDGEDVLEMDFSGFQTPGRYYLQVPGVGRSWSFELGDNAVGRPFYVHMRGLYHQRSGIAKIAEFTRWTVGLDHPRTFRAAFAPNDRHYGENSGCFTGADGKPVKVGHFEMIAATATEEVLPGVSGGWWDAGDFDRRSYHFEVVDALLSIYLLFPEKFLDRQLDLPESGNGVPDLIDEAAWGVEVWRRAQRDDGGVGCWIEATSHPRNPDPARDLQPYYAALPTRESSMYYSAMAAKLARAYRRCGRPELARRFYESAAMAWRFAVNPLNRAETRFTLPKKGLITYREPEELPKELVYKAALNLYLFSGEAEYETALDGVDLQAIFARLDHYTPYFLGELAEDLEDPMVFTHAAAFRQFVRKKLPPILKSQQELAYRNCNWPLNHHYFLNLAWGNTMPFKFGAYLVLGWAIDEDVRYRDALLLFSDWMLGANPMGRSVTTGLGEIYPVRLLSLPMWAREQEFPDPFPGITQYTFSGYNEYSLTTMVQRFEVEPRKDFHFTGRLVNLMPRTMGGDNPELTRPECYKLLQSNVPVWRRFANLEGNSVKNSEFTVWETIAPAAAAYAALLPDHWLPPPEWKTVEPRKRLDEIPGYIFLP